MSNVNFPTIAPEQLIQRLQPPKGKVRMVLDTDTFNEIDDQFAVVYALLSKERMNVEAFYAAPFHNELSDSPEDGMEKSYHELLKIREIMDREDIPVFKGSSTYLPEQSVPVESEAARDLVNRAMASDPSDPLYVVAIGAISNIASALLMEPRIIERIVVVWLGGHNLHWPDTREFNLFQDLHATRLVLDCGVPLIQVPCMGGVASNLQTTLSEIRDYVKPQGAIGEYLYQTYLDCRDDHFASSRVIWDISVIGWLNNQEWVPSNLIPSPLVSDDFRWSVDQSRHLIRCAWSVNRDEIFKDLFLKLAEHIERRLTNANS